MGDLEKGLMLRPGRLKTGDRKCTGRTGCGYMGKKGLERHVSAFNWHDIAAAPFEGERHLPNGPAPNKQWVYRKLQEKSRISKPP